MDMVGRFGGGFHDPPGSSSPRTACSLDVKLDVLARGRPGPEPSSFESRLLFMELFLLSALVFGGDLPLRERWLDAELCLDSALLW